VSRDILPRSHPLPLVVPGRVEGELAKQLSVLGISHSFVMDWSMILRDIVIGLLLAGALAAWVPDSFWQGFFLVHHPLLAKLWGPLVGPAGNGGLSFGGVIAFIFADLIILPIINIYRKYYGAKMSLFLLGIFYAAMAAAGYIVELLFGGLHLIPAGPRHAKVIEASIQLNYTTVLNGLFLLLAIVLVVRFFWTGGRAMPRMMNEPMEEAGEHHHPHEVTQDALSRRSEHEAAV
jgi:uncharacterized protein